MDMLIGVIVCCLISIYACRTKQQIKWAIVRVLVVCFMLAYQLDAFILLAAVFWPLIEANDGQ